jgi:predicted PurR-regulated permease PerM
MPAPEPVPMRPFVARVLVTLALVALGLAAWALRGVLLLAFAAVLVAVILDALAAVGQRLLRLPRGVAIAVSVAAVAAALGGAAWLFGAQMRGQLDALSDALPEAWRSLRARAGEVVPFELPDDWLADSMPSGSRVLTTVRSIAASVAGGLADLAVAVVGGIYLAADPSPYRTGFLKLLPASRRTLAADALDACGRALRAWLLGQGASMLAVGAATALGLWWIGVPSPVALGLVAALLDFVPVVGPIVALLPAMVLALAQGMEPALWTAGLYLAVQQLEGNVIQPLVAQRVVELPAALLVFAILAAGTLFGAPGVVLAAPLTVVVFVLVKRLYVREALDTPTPVPGERRE